VERTLQCHKVYPPRKASRSSGPSIILSPLYVRCASLPSTLSGVGDCISKNDDTTGVTDVGNADSGVRCVVASNTDETSM